MESEFQMNTKNHFNQPYLSSIVLEGFGSYREETIVPLLPGLNVITGPNGSGKTVLLEAILFVTNQKPRMRSWRDSINLAENKAEVSIKISDYNGKEHIFTRIIENNLRRASIYKIDGKTTTLGNIRKKLKQLQIPFDNPLLTIRANTLTPLINQLKDSSDVTSKQAIRNAIEESTGISLLVQKYSNAINSLYDKKNVIQSLEEEIAAIAHELKVLSDEKVKLIKKRDLENKLFAIKENLLILQYETLKQGIDPKENKLIDLESSLDDIQKSKEEKQIIKNRLTEEENRVTAEKGFKEGQLKRINMEISDNQKKRSLQLTKIKQMSEQHPNLDIDKIYAAVRQVKIDLDKNKAEYARLKLDEIQEQYAMIDELKIEREKILSLKENVNTKRGVLKNTPDEFYKHLTKLEKISQEKLIENYENRKEIKKMIKEIQMTVKNKKLLEKEIEKEFSSELENFFQFFDEIYDNYKGAQSDARKNQSRIKRRIQALEAKDPTAVYPNIVKKGIDILYTRGEEYYLPMCAYIKDLSNEAEKLIRSLLSEGELFAFFIKKNNNREKLVKNFEDYLKRKKLPTMEVPLIISYTEQTTLNKTTEITGISDKNDDEINKFDFTDFIEHKIKSDHLTTQNMWGILSRLPEPMFKWLWERLGDIVVKNNYEAINKDNNDEKTQLANKEIKSVRNSNYFINQKFSTRISESDNYKFKTYYFHKEEEMLFALAETEKIIENLKEELKSNQEDSQNLNKIISQLEEGLVLKNSFTKRIMVYQRDLPQLLSLETEFERFSDELKELNSNISNLEQEYRSLKTIETRISELIVKERDYNNIEEIQKDLAILEKKVEEDRIIRDTMKEDVDKLQTKYNRTIQELNNIRKAESEQTDMLIDTLKNIDILKRELQYEREDLKLIITKLPKYYRENKGNVEYELITNKELLQRQKVRLEEEITGIKIMYPDADERLKRMKNQESKAIQYILELKMEITSITNEAVKFENSWEAKITNLLPKIEKQTNEILNTLKQQYRIKLLLEKRKKNKKIKDYEISDINLRPTMENGNLEKKFTDKEKIETIQGIIENSNIKLIIETNLAERKNYQVDPLLLSEGQKSLVIISFIFGLQRAAGEGQVFLLDEFDQNLDAVNSSTVWQIVKTLSSETQYLILTPNPKAEHIKGSQMLITVSKPRNSSSKILLYPNVSKIDEEELTLS